MGRRLLLAPIWGGLFVIFLPLAGFVLVGWWVAVSVARMGWGVGRPRDPGANPVESTS